ncbi:sugar epimerase [Chryseobacterium sp. Leaf405]|uniref:WxcM-like domain-containing protein n=1 Tax=Chryseobacterium sp. Leaf405 TaxID=1736367 RepID=UPI0006F7E90A|nr:WxcM-like domain-containing protein [Chryseobacterium sp. Leaf405]KQT24068.1 sugar epimerase [Chryseobacterium sp. Leaf405]
MNVPKIIHGEKYSDERGRLFFNNNFDVSPVKRIYFIENNSTEYIRGWTGHKIEQRWFTASKGVFIIKLIEIDNWENPSKNSEILEFELSSEKLDILYMPSGYVSAIRAKEENSKLLVMVNYSLGEINDEYRFPSDYFENIL